MIAHFTLPSLVDSVPYWPTATPTLERGNTWVACKEQSRVIRVALPAGPLRSVPVGGWPIAVVTASAPSGLSTRAAASRESTPAAPESRVDPTGLPTMATLRRVDPATGKVTTPSRAERRVDVHGLVPYRTGVLLADNTGGRLYEVPG